MSALAPYPEPDSVAPAPFTRWCEENETLTIDLTSLFGYPCQLVVSGWKDQCAWYSVLYGEIEHPETYSDPGMDLFSPTDDENITRWQQTIPEDIRSRLAHFGRWWFSLLRMACVHKEAMDLLEGNPLLLWLWLCHCQIHKISDDVMIAGLGQKQAVLLQAMELIATPANARMLRRVVPEQLDEQIRRRIVELWRCYSALDTLRHCPTITENHLRLLHYYPILRELPLFYTIVEQDCPWTRTHNLNILRDCVRMGLNDILRRCRTLESLQRIHDRYMVRQNRNGNGTGVGGQKDANGKPLPFPAPPHPGTDRILPITTPADLQREGEEMMHCVGSYIRTVQKGGSYIYRLLEPQRVTIGVTLRNGEIFAIEQIKGARNAMATAEVREIVNEWFVELKRARKSDSSRGLQQRADDLLARIAG